MEGTIGGWRFEIKVLIFGIGNPGRRDDGLGPALLAEMRSAAGVGVSAGESEGASFSDGSDAGVKGRAVGSPIAGGLYPRASTAETDPQVKPGAPDDPVVADAVGVAFEFRYQLNVEDAYTIRDFDVVVFADAKSVGGEGGAKSVKGRASGSPIASGLFPRASTAEVYLSKPGAPATVDKSGARDVGEDDDIRALETGAAAPDVSEGAVLTEIGPSATIAFTTHEMSPSSVLALCHELYGSAPRAYMLAIRGYEWDMGEGLSEGARANLKRAVDVLRRFLKVL